MNRIAWCLGACLTLLTFAAVAGNARGVRETIESSMQVTGTVDVAADGSVAAYALDRQDQLPPGVVRLLGDNVPKWRFEPTGGGVVRAKMSLLMIAKKLDNEHFRVNIRAADFEDAVERPGQAVSAKRMSPPAFPRGGAPGTVYLVLRIDREGKVADAMVEQVNMRVVSTEQRLEQVRQSLSQNALRAAKRWTFNVPTDGDAAKEAFWSVRVPVDYNFAGQHVATYGEWATYVPGTRQRIPWDDASSDDPAFGPDALIAGDLYTPGGGPRLLTPLDRG